MGALRFSPKQRQVLTWWREGSPHWEKSAIICDGAVRSGKTLCLGLSFFLWAMARFQGRRFALCGRSMEGVRRNLTGEVLPLLRGMGFQCREQLTRGEVTVSLGRRRNIFCLFGGGDEGAAARIQGVTLAGALLAWKNGNITLLSVGLWLLVVFSKGKKRGNRACLIDKKKVKSY